MKPNIHIRQATPADLPQVIQLDHEAFGPYGTAESPEIIHARQQVFPKGFIVAEVSGRIIGYGSAEKWPDMREPGLDEDPRSVHDPQGRILNITGMAVQEAFQRQGVGAAMTQRLIRLARQHRCHTVILETTHARDFYRRLGFDAFSQRTERDVTLFIMTLALEESAPR